MRAPNGWRTVVSTYSLDKDYRETVRLKDGVMVLLRLVEPSDKGLLARGMAQLSPRSRYYRFFAPKNTLSDKDLRYFTEVDGVNHFAVGALKSVSDNNDEGVGVARFVRFAEQPEMAELAITVVDEMQGKGLGYVLLLRLIAAARERGILNLHADVLADNKRMLALLRKVAPAEHIHGDGDVIELDFNLREVV
jgi:RimJ/RimL family protein N-acetyltransferase